MAGDTAPKLAALDQELENLHAASFGWALACCRFDRQEAEDVLQIAYLRALEGRARFNGHSSTRTWFFGVVKRTAQEKRRSRLLRGLALERLWRAGRGEAQSGTPESLSAEAEAQERLKRSLLRLSTRQRDLLHLVFYQELTIEEAAGVLHLSVGTARTHYERGKARLRALLSAAGDHHEQA